MNIGGLQKLTLLDYPDKLAAIVFTKGCNFICPFCQNGSLVIDNSSDIQPEEVLNFLGKRRGVLDGVVITGGEPLIQKDIKEFSRKIKDMGYLIKLDTNGYFPDELDDLLREQLIDYVAMDIKNIPSKYAETVGISFIDIEKIFKSINCIKNANIGYEFRTTMVKPFHENDDFLEIAKWIGKDSKYYLQSFRDGDDVIGKGMKAFSKEETMEIYSKIKQEFPLVALRG